MLMTTIADSFSKLEDSAATTAQAAWSWSGHVAAEAYQGVRQVMPVSEKHKDEAVAVVGTVAAATVAAAFCKPVLGRMLTGSAEAAAPLVRAEGVSIVPLTSENLSAAIAAGKNGFRYGGPFLNPAKDFKASLDPVLNASRLSLDPKQEANARYWLAVDKKGNVLGTTGLYETGKDQAEASWLGWMSVRSSARGQGIGKQLVDFSVAQARADGKDFVRLYTSTARGEQAAQFLYEKEGFKVVGSEPHTIPRLVQRVFGEKEPLKILFRELDLRAK
jgi:ribosomal protein S18 acetylase RimI-like enzyme